jgi:SOS-response transcriptional repressor LexA
LILIKNNLFGSIGKSETSKFHVFGTIGFTIFSYLLLETSYKKNKVINTNCSQIMNFLNIKSKKTINKYLSILQKNNLIQCDYDTLNLKKNQFVLIDLNNYYKNDNVGFELIPEEIFVKKINQIKHIGWSIFCFLAKQHNENLGEEFSSGYADISEYTIANVLDVHRNTISKNIKVLEKENLIKIIPSKTLFIGYDHKGKEIYKLIPNKYIVNYKANVPSLNSKY